MWGGWEGLYGRPPSLSAPCHQPYRATRATIREALAPDMPGACQQGPPNLPSPPSPLRIRALRRRLPPKNLPVKEGGSGVVLGRYTVLSGAGFSEGGHRVRKDGAMLGGEGLPAPQTGCPCGTTLVSIVSALKKPTRKRHTIPQTASLVAVLACFLLMDVDPAL